MDQELVDSLLQTLRMYSPDDSTFLHEMTSWPPSWTCQKLDSSIDAHIFEEHSCRISSRSDL